MISLFKFRQRKIQLILVLLLIITVIFAIHNIVTREGSSVKDDIRNDDSKNSRLTIVVPFRDRFDELIIFVPYIAKYLRLQGLESFKIFIINQSAKYRFNRGALINIGFLLSRNVSDYIAMHDIDLLPINRNLSYSYPEDGPYHLSSPEYHPQYNYSKFIGGILLINNHHFEIVNGMSNRYFGWGMEDDEFYTRLKAANISIYRPMNLTTNRNNTFLHIHHDRKRDTFKSKEQREASKYRDKKTGLRNIKYAVKSEHHLTIDKLYNCTLFNVELYCDINDTPWCQLNYGRRFPNG